MAERMSWTRKVSIFFFAIMEKENVDAEKKTGRITGHSENGGCRQERWGGVIEVYEEL